MQKLLLFRRLWLPFASRERKKYRLWIWKMCASAKWFMCLMPKPLLPRDATREFLKSVISTASTADHLCAISIAGPPNAYAGTLRTRLQLTWEIKSREKEANKLMRCIILQSGWCARVHTEPDLYIFIRTNFRVGRVCLHFCIDQYRFQSGEA